MCLALKNPNASLERSSGLRAPDPNAAGAAGDFPNLHRAVIGQVTLHPLDVPRSVEPELEVLLTEPRDGNPRRWATSTAPPTPPSRGRRIRRAASRWPRTTAGAPSRRLPGSTPRAPSDVGRRGLSATVVAPPEV